MQIILDIETTGFSPKQHEIIEFAAILIGNDYSELSSFSTLIRPKMKLSKHITKLTGLTMNTLQHAPYIEEVNPLIQQYLSTHHCVGHNIIKFDAPFLKQNNLLFKNRLIDTLEISRNYKITNKHSLEYLCQYYKIRREREHRALDDARATLQLYKILTMRKRIA